MSVNVHITSSIILRLTEGWTSLEEEEEEEEECTENNNTFEGLYPNISATATFTSSLVRNPLLPSSTSWKTLKIGQDYYINEYRMAYKWNDHKGKSFWNPPAHKYSMDIPLQIFMFLCCTLCYRECYVKMNKWNYKLGWIKNMNEKPEEPYRFRWVIIFRYIVYTFGICTHILKYGLKIWWRTIQGTFLTSLL